MDFLTITYLIYSFISFYFLFLFILIYTQNKNKLFSYPLPKKDYSLSIVVPCYNECKSIGETIKAILESDYKNIEKIIVVDDCSTDNSYEIIKKFAEKYPKVIALQTPKNTGKAGGAKNYGAKFVTTELIGFVDADSYPDKNAISKMIGFFDDEKIGAMTSLILVRNRNKLIEKLQAIEYKIIAFSRKLLSFIGSVYVTPGPLAIYRKNAFEEIGGFDEKNLTEDIEITWNFVDKGYQIGMSLLSQVYTVAPDNFKKWFKQRIRWNVGGLQTINKYKKSFFKKGMLGQFILPFFVLSWILAIFGLGIIIYTSIRTLIIQFLSTKYSIQAQTTILSLRDINLSPNILIFLGIILLFLNISITAISLIYSKEKDFKKHGFTNIFLYMFFYLLTYPIILIASSYKYLKGKNSW